MNGAKRTISDYPEIMEQWDWERNVGIDPANLAHKSEKRVFWKCPVAYDHRWDAFVYQRTSGGQACPFCAKFRPSSTHNLTIVRPDIASQWDYQKNGDSRPEDFLPGSKQMVFWKCSVADDHQWSQLISSRNHAGKATCPFCTNKKLSITNSLALVNPDVAAQWDTMRNGGVTPDLIVAGSCDYAWWICLKNPLHQWRAQIRSRAVGGMGCPICSGFSAAPDNCLRTTHPEMAREWHPDKNGDKTPDTVVAGHNASVWWRCLKDTSHEWEVSPCVRTRKKPTGCPFCSHTKVHKTNCLSTLRPDLAEEWDYENNDGLTPWDIVVGARRKFNWVCKGGHRWSASADQRHRANSGCPACKATSGEARIMSLLDKLDIQYKFQYAVRIGDRRPLRFDFAVFVEEAIAGLVEFQGIQHFEEIFPEADLAGYQERDRIKVDYAKTNGIPLLRIHYSQESDVEILVVEFLNSLYSNKKAPPR